MKQSQSPRKSDPHREREAQRYENPIPSRELILEVIEEAARPMHYQDLAEVLEVNIDADEGEALDRRLRAMCRDGQLVRNRKNGFCIVNRRDLISGRVIGHPDGFGFLHPDDGGDDLFLSPRAMRSLWHGDRAVVTVTGVDRKGRREGALVEILERAVEQLVGRLEDDHGTWVVVPEHKRLTNEVIVEPEDLNGGGEGQMVVVEILEHPDARHHALGKVVEVLGEHMAPGMETDVAIRSHNIPIEWPEAVEQEIAGLGPVVPEEAKKGRKDIRNLPLVTIDGADSRDFDDAVYAERTKKGWKLLVCIADVSAYVQPGSALDQEAYKRGNSVYFPDRVVPMLPEILSNGLCSINPNADRLCMCAELLINEQGEVYRSKFFEGVMRSHARLIYDDVAAMLVDGDGELCAKYAEVLPHLHELYALFQVLLKSRMERGAIDFDTTEARFQFDDAGKVKDIIASHRNDAHRLIEECMLAANVAAARQLEKRRLLKARIPGLFRVHESPSAEKLEDLHAFLKQLGLSMGGGKKPTAKDYSNLLEKVKGRADAHMIQTVLLRSMMQAQYQADNKGHFGLAFDAYTHFTSPIRRYPDLVVHRALKHLIAGGSASSFAYGKLEMEHLTEHCSATERRADEATRDATDALKCEYMLDKVGETHNGVVVTVTGFGLFVELEETYVTGLVHITALDLDYFHFDPIGHCLNGERTGKTYRLGDTVKVKVAAVNLDDRKIDLVLADAEGRDGDRAKKKKRKR